MRKLLFISPTYPFPEDRGWNIRVSNLLKACSENFSVTLVSPQPQETARDACKDLYERFVGIDDARTSASTKTPGAWRRLFEKIYDSRGNARKRYKAAVSRLNLNDYDLIWVERRSQFACVQSHADRVILDLDDIEHKKLWQELLLSKGFFSKIQLLPRLVGIFLEEILVTRKARAVVVCSDGDKAYLNRFGLKKVHTVPNGTSIQNGNRATDERLPKAVFLGNMGYPPNIDGVQYFDEKIMPIVASACPDFQLDVVGPAPQEPPAHSDRVHYLGFVSNLQATLQNYAVMIVPLRFGGGTKLKVLDAMASGVPIVSTTIGTEGLDIEHKVHALVANEPNDFAQQVLLLIDHPDMGARLRSNAHDLVMKKFAWTNIRRETSNLLASL